MEVGAKRRDLLCLTATVPWTDDRIRFDAALLMWESGSALRAPGRRAGTSWVHGIGMARSSWPWPCPCPWLRGRGAPQPQLYRLAARPSFPVFPPCSSSSSSCRFLLLLLLIWFCVACLPAPLLFLFTSRHPPLASFLYFFLPFEILRPPLFFSFLSSLLITTIIIVGVRKLVALIAVIQSCAPGVVLARSNSLPTRLWFFICVQMRPWNGWIASQLYAT